MLVDSFIDKIRNITRKDSGINGDAQRIEQISWLLFLRIYDSKEKVWELEDDTYVSIIPDELKWRNWAQNTSDNVLTAESLLDFVNNKLLVGLKNLEINAKTPIKKRIVKLVFEDANNYMKNGVLLRQVINIIDSIEFEDPRQRHLFNDIYELILKEIQSAGASGEFYTPRPLTDFIVKALNPKLGETMADFACGTGGFLVSTLNELAKQKVSVEDIDLYNKSVFGIEKKAFPYVLAITNLLLHDVDEPNIVHGNSLERNVREYKESEKFDIIMMNPPFGGSEDKSLEVNFPAELRSGETADLFMSLIMYRLKQNGRAAVIIPDGFLFGKGAKTNIKKKLIEEFNLHTIVRLPSSIFSPYTSIRTNVLFFDKSNEKTKGIWFYRLNMPEGYKAFNRTKTPLKYEHFNVVHEWLNNKQEILNKENDGFQSKYYLVNEIEQLDYNLDLCGFPNVEEESLNPIDLIDKFINKQKELNENISNTLSEIVAKINEKGN